MIPPPPNQACGGNIKAFVTGALKVTRSSHAELSSLCKHAHYVGAGFELGAFVTVAAGAAKRASAREDSDLRAFVFATPPV